MVEWCKEAIKKAEMIKRHGKNWYSYYKGYLITVNANSHTIITTHKINPRVRKMEKSDYGCLSEFLYQAIVFMIKNYKIR